MEMDPLEILKARHSVRSYRDRPFDEVTLRQLNDVIDRCRQESGLNIQVCLNERQAFDSLMERMGKFSNVSNYIALMGDKSPNTQEKAGYCGEKIVLKAVELGLGTCWVGSSYSKRKCGANKKNGEKLFCVITFGFSDQAGVPHTTKPITELCQVWTHA